MTATMREEEAKQAIYESLASQDWTDEYLLRKQAEARLGRKLRQREFSRCIVALIGESCIEQRRVRSNGTQSLVPMRYRRIASRKEPA